jgi:hypothetical protein
MLELLRLERDSLRATRRIVWCCSWRRSTWAVWHFKKLVEVKQKKQGNLSGADRDQELESPGMEHADSSVEQFQQMGDDMTFEKVVVTVVVVVEID